MGGASFERLYTQVSVIGTYNLVPRVFESNSAPGVSTPSNTFVVLLGPLAVIWGGETVER